LKKWDPCWRLFTYTAILNESRYLSRAIKGITAAVGGASAGRQQFEVPTSVNSGNMGSNGRTLGAAGARASGPGNDLDDILNALRFVGQVIRPPERGDFTELLGCLTQLESDVGKASDFVKGTIEMVRIVFFHQ